MRLRSLLAVLAAAACSRAPSPVPTPAPLPSPAHATAATLQATIAARLDSLPAASSFYAKDLATGREVAIRADQPMNTASVIKLPVMVLAFRDADAGKLDLDQRHTITQAEIRGGSGLLQTFAPGLQPTLRDLVTQMVITSDNTATDIMIGVVGLDRVNRLLDSLGYRETRLRMTVADVFRASAASTPRNLPDSERVARAIAFVGDSSQWLGRTTAREIGRLLEQIQTGRLASEAPTQAMIRIMRRQFYTSRLPQRIGSRIPIAHKTGDWPPYLGNDVGILFAPAGPIVVAVFTNQNRGSFFELEATEGRIAEDVVTAWRP